MWTYNQDLCSLMRQYVDLLYERRYISSRHMDEAAVNRYSHDVRIFRAILAGAFYPNLVMATARKARCVLFVYSHGCRKKYS